MFFLGKKKKLTTIILIVAVLSGLFFSNIAVLAQENKVYNWKMASCWSPEQNLLEGDLYFAKIVNEMSGGRINITVHPAPEIVALTEVFDAVAAGTVEVGGIWPGYWSGKSGAFELIASFPMNMIQPNFLTWYLEYGGKELIQSVFNRFGLQYFVNYVIPMQAGISGNKALRTIDDFKGLQVRLAGRAQGHVLDQLGARNVQIAPGEVYTALQLGTLDASELCTFSFNWDSGLQEVTKYVNGPGWHEPGTAYGAIINLNVWNSLPDDLKHIIDLAHQVTLLRNCSYYEALEIEAFKKHLDYGIEMVRLDEEALKEIERITMDYVTMRAKEDEDFYKIALSMFQFLKDIEPVHRYQEPFQKGRIRWYYPELEGLK